MSAGESDPDLSWLLLPRGSTRMVGPEVETRSLGDVRFPVRARHGVIVLFSDPNGSRRFVYEAGGYGLVSGLQVMTDHRSRPPVVANVYTVPRFRRRGIAAELFAVARRALGPIEHSSSLSESGARFAARNKTAGASRAADESRRLSAVARANPDALRPGGPGVALVTRGPCLGEGGPIAEEPRGAGHGTLAILVTVAADGTPGDGHRCEVSRDDAIVRRPAYEREVDRLRRIRGERSHELVAGLNYANATTGRGRGRVVAYRCRACGHEHERRPRRCVGCGAS